MKKHVCLILLVMTMILEARAQYRSVIWEKFLYSGPGLKQTGWLATKSSSEISSSSWSVGCETLDRDYAKFSLYKDYVGELGVKRGRLQSGWAKCEKEKGKYNFAWLDTCVYGLAEQKVNPWICLCYGNPLYGSDIKLGAKIFTDEKAMTAWLKYVETTVTRYKDVVKEWEIWNEPNGGNNPPEYTSLLIKTAEVIRKVQPDGRIMGFSLAGVALNFAEGVFKILKEQNKLGLVDILTYHPYTNNPDDSYGEVEKLKALKDSYNPKIQLFQGENGCPSILEWTHALANYPWTEVSQAKWFMRRMAGDRMRDIPSSIFTLIDLQYWNMLQSFGLLRSNVLHQVIYKRPSYHGVQHMVSVFDNTVVPVGELAFRTNAYREMTVAGFKKGDSPLVLTWYKDQIPGDELKWDLVNLTIKDVNFKDPVYVEIISGKVFEISKQDWTNNDKDVTFKNLPVWDSPVLIAERSAIVLKPDAM
jgi:polysaccharide biosynthesis protein PslG